MKKLTTTVLYCDGKCTIAELQEEFTCDEDGLEVKLVKAAEKHFGFPCEQIGIPADYIEVTMPDDYEPCGTCGFDHAYDGVGRACNPTTQKV